MFDKNFNVIIGDRSSHRTTFLIEVSRAIRSQGGKVLFLGGTLEFEDFANNSISRIFDLALFFKGDLRLIENLNEISQRDGYQFIFIDDVNYISKPAIDLLSKNPIKKVCTCLTDVIPNFGVDVNLYDIKNHYDDSNFTNSTFLKVNKQMINLKDIIKEIERDQKIENLLKR